MPPPAPGYGYGPPPQQRSNGLAIAGLVCGIVGLLLFGIVLGPLSLIFGWIGLNRSRQGASGRGMAIAAIVLGILDTVAAVILLAVITNRGVVY
jgi:hypothetical protein